MTTGKVRWFNPDRGFGFVDVDGSDDTLFVHFSSVQMEGFKTLLAGDHVTFDVEPADKGPQAVNVRVVQAA
jgi:CspA family cold shock protein